MGWCMGLGKNLTVMIVVVNANVMLSMERFTVMKINVIPTVCMEKGMNQPDPTISLMMVASSVSAVSLQASLSAMRYLNVKPAILMQIMVEGTLGKAEPFCVRVVAFVSFVNATVD